MHCCDASCSVLEILPFLEYNRTRWHLFCDAQSAKKYIFFLKNSAVTAVFSNVMARLQKIKCKIVQFHGRIFSFVLSPSAN